MMASGATDVVVGTLDYGKIQVPKATMGFKHRALEAAPSSSASHSPTFC